MRYLSLFAAFLTTAFALGQEPTPEQIAAYQAHITKTLSGIQYQEGKAELPDKTAHLELPSGYRYLNPSDAKKVIVDLWGNPPGSADEVLGLVVPAGEQLEDPNSWAVVLTFEKDGYVSDEDADKINYNDLLKQLKENNKQGNEERKSQGFETLDLVGWAVSPKYDKERKVLYWAKELHAQNSDENTLNYDVRVLGRYGVLSLNAVSGMNRVKDVEAATPAIVQMAQFNDGQRYADFNPSTDKKANYSLAGLVLGGAIAAKLAAKGGLLKGLIALLVAGKKFIVIGAIAVAVGVKKLLGRRSEA